MMRTTLNLPDDVGHIVRSFAESKGISMGDAAAELIRRGLHSENRLGQDSGIPCFSVKSDAKPITLEQTLAVEDEI